MRIMPKPNTQTNKDPKGKSVISEFSKQDAKDIEYFRCHENGHIASQCPTRNLLVEPAHVDYDEFEGGIYEPIGNANDSYENVRVFTTRLNIVRCLYTVSRDEHWHRSSIFLIYITHKGKNYKVIVNGCSCFLIGEQLLLALGGLLQLQ